jgi:flagellar motility protein MotE (MotC chaperone)
MSGFLLRSLRGVRLVPVVLAATIALFALKALDLVLDGGSLFDNGRDDTEITGTIAAPRPGVPLAKPSPAAGKQSWAQEMFNYPGATGSAGSPASRPEPDITGSVGETPTPPKEEGGKSEAPATKKVPLEPPPGPGGKAVSPAERSILESLQKRRAELDARAHELDVREDLLRAAEKRVGGRIDELKDLEARVDAALQQKDEGEAARFKNLITMYENMKPKDAAKIFDGLDTKVLLDVSKDLNPRKMSDILAQMVPENAQRLTVELAVRSAQKDLSPAELPTIQGKPTPN